MLESLPRPLVQHARQLRNLCSSLQGAGKSTFSNLVLQHAHGRWLRINQDTLKTRKKCEAAAHRALKERQNVIIDRCNFDQQQRATWTQIAAQYEVTCCAVWLAISAKECARRARQRRHHEGGMTGPPAEKTSFQVSAQITRTRPLGLAALRNLPACLTVQCSARAQSCDYWFVKPVSFRVDLFKLCKRCGASQWAKLRRAAGYHKH